MSIKVVTLQQALRDLVAAATAVIDAAFVCSPDLWARLNTALADARVVLPESSGMPGHNELLERGAEYLNDGVYAEETAAGIKLTGDAYGRKNEIFLEGNEYAALRLFARKHGYETEADRKLFEHVHRCPLGWMDGKVITPRGTGDEVVIRWIAELQRLVALDGPTP
jgi:hypothetical protein